MRVSELVPRVKNKRFFLPFLTLGTSTKLLGFMRVLAILDPLEISSGGCTPGKPVRGRTGQAALSPSARAGSCAPGMPPICVPQRREGHSKINGADARYRLDQARASARRSKARFDSGGTPPRTRGTGSIRRGISRRPKARIDSGGTPPVRGRTGHAALSPSARAGGCTPGMPASCVPQGRKGPSEISGADASQRIDQARASARRSKARFDSGGTPPRT